MSPTTAVFPRHYLLNRKFNHGKWTHDPTSHFCLQYRHSYQFPVKIYPKENLFLIWADHKIKHLSGTQYSAYCNSFQVQIKNIFTNLTVCHIHYKIVGNQLLQNCDCSLVDLNKCQVRISATFLHVWIHKLFCHSSVTHNLLNTICQIPKSAFTCFYW